MCELVLLAETVSRECTFALWLNLATPARGQGAGGFAAGHGGHPAAATPRAGRCPGVAAAGRRGRLAPTGLKRAP